MGCLDVRVHVHACSCACWAACLIWWQWDSLKRKHSLLQWQEQEAVLCLPPNPLPPPPLVLVPQGWRRNTVSRCRLWALLCRKSLAGFWRKEQFCSWPCSFMVPLPCASRTCCCLLGSGRKAGLWSLQWVEASVAGLACCHLLPLEHTGA